MPYSFRSRILFNYDSWLEVATLINRANYALTQQRAECERLYNLASSSEKELLKAQRQFHRYSARLGSLRLAQERLADSATPWELTELDFAITDGELCLSDAECYLTHAKKSEAAQASNETAVAINRANRALDNVRANFKKAEAAIESASINTPKTLVNSAASMGKTAPISAAAFPAPSLPITNQETPLQQKQVRSHFSENHTTRQQSKAVRPMNIQYMTHIII